jgi:mono/diheme cytochrome c family protein
MREKKIFFVVLVSFLVGSCSPSGNKPNVEIIQDMMDQVSVKAQKKEDFLPHGISALVPPEHTQPVGKKPYPYATDLNKALAELKNPLQGNLSEEILLVGQKFYNTHCLVCHGEKALGDGPLKPKYPLPIPSLVSDKVKSWPDAHIFHVITVGQGIMGAYGSQVPEKVRWHLVNYIRHLQK